MSVLIPSTFLELTQRLFQECQLPGSGPATLASASGQTFDLAAWISQSCKEIDELHEDWSYLLVHPGVAFTTVAAQQLYTPTQAGVTVGEVGQWKLDTFRNYLTSSGYPSEIEMTWIDYDNWLRTEKIGVLRTTQVRPMVFTIAPDKSIGLQCPLAGYTVIGDYYRIPVVLEVDADTPLIPQRYRMAIVYKAMMAYATSENAPEIYNEGERNYRLQLAAMSRTLLPTIRSTGALA
jgi:hypothetical protein